MNIEAIRAKLKAMESGKPKRAKWKPTDEHTVRCLPLPGEEDLALVLKWHYGVDNQRQMYCPSTHGDECPFCDLAKFLKSWKDEKGRDKPEPKRKLDWEWFKKVEAAVKHYVPIVVRKKDSTDVEGPFLWEMTPKTYTSLFKICANEDRNEDHPDGGGLRILTSLKDGVDVTVTLKKKGEKGNTTSFDLTEVEPRLKPSALVKGDLAAAEALVARVPDLSEVGKPITTAEADAIFAVWKSSMDDSPADVRDGGIEHGTNGSEQAKSGGLSVDEVVAKLNSMAK